MFSLGDWLRLTYTSVIIIFLLYLISPEGFPGLLWFLALYLVIDLAITGFVRFQRRQRSREAVQEYLADNAEDTGEASAMVSSEITPVFERLSQALKDANTEIQTLKARAGEERLLLERWVHEVKTPLALFLLLLENEKDQLDPETYNEFHRLREELEMQVMQILYYGKMDATHPDERFEKTSLLTIVRQVLHNLHYEAILRSINFDITTNTSDFEISTDPRILQLVLTQILNNAFKYSPAEGAIHISLNPKDRRLSIRDEGAGVRPEDLPFLFDRAFSGVHPNRSTSTGLGLYLAKFYSQRLGIELIVDPVSADGGGFLMHLDFPALESVRLRGKDERAFELNL